MIKSNDLELPTHLSNRLHQFSDYVTEAFSRKLEARGVTAAEWAMIRMLYGTQPISQSLLADKMGWVLSTISRLTDRLIEKALVSRERSAADGRVQTLQLTAKGERLVPKLAALAEQNEAECFAHLSNQDRLTLTRILDESVRHLGIAGPPIK